MVNFFIGEISFGRIGVADVPKLWRKKVEAKLAELEAAREPQEPENAEAGE